MRLFTICSTGSVSTHQGLISNQTAIEGRCSRGISRLSNKELKNLLGIRDSYRVNVEICIISCYILR